MGRTPEEVIVEVLASDCRVHEHRGCSGCKTLVTVEDLKDAKECWGETAKVIAAYYETAILEKIKEAVRELIAELEDQLVPAYPNPATDQIRYYTLDKDDLLKMKRDRGIE